ncbi:MAG TPA: DUF1801 domain-containing protein [Flavisolibacter sp.]|nr:DUF1801 domain-containing protein [Flavisolibacter sp.]
MTSTAKTTKEYLEALPEDRKIPMTQLLDTIAKNLPKGFTEQMNYGMPSFVVPHSIYPAGYHCDPKLPLGFVSIASQKNFIVLYHMGIYSMPDLMEWFTEEYPRHSQSKLDMGKSCIRFKKPEQIPYGLIAELMKKVTPDQWIAQYEMVLKRQK